MSSAYGTVATRSNVGARTGLSRAVVTGPSTTCWSRGADPAERDLAGDRAGPGPRTPPCSMRSVAPVAVVHRPVRTSWARLVLADDDGPQAQTRAGDRVDLGLGRVVERPA